MKKLICMLMCVALLPVCALAEDSAAEALTLQELSNWASAYIAQALTAEPLNVPADNLTSEGYEFEYGFGALYADTPDLGVDSVVSSVVVTSMEAAALRDVNVGADLYAVLDAYYNENPELLGSYESAVLYTLDNLPESAGWAKVNRDGQRVQTVQYAVHELLPSGGEGYADAGVIYTMAENRVSAVRVYGLNSRITLDTVNDVMYSAMLDALVKDYALVPFSYDGSELTALGEEDMVFSGMSFLTMTAEDAVALLGEPASDDWLENGEDGFIRVQTFPQAEITWLYDQNKANGRIYMLQIAADGLEGPRAVRCGDTFSSVYNRFRNGEGVYQEDGTEVLYGQEDEGAFGHVSYGNDASALLRYGFTAQDGRKVVLRMSFSVMALTEIMLYAE